MKLVRKELLILVAFADEGDRRGGTTAWGPKFDATMQVARDVRARALAEQGSVYARIQTIAEAELRGDLNEVLRLTQSLATTLKASGYGR